MNTATQIKIGDTIKSFDFPNHDDCYMVGEVVAVSDEIIECRTLQVVFAGQDKGITGDHNKTFCTRPIGFGLFDDIPGQRPRIQIIN